MFLVCGEALFDVFTAAATSAGLALDARMGGSPFNVAIGLSRLGQAVCYLGAVSRDAFGERLMSALRESGVDTVFVQRTDAPTTLTIVGLDQHGVPTYAFHGAHGADRDLRLGAIASLPDAVRVIHVGSYSMVVEPIATTLRELIEREHRYRLIACDPNVRLNVERARERWREALDWMAMRTHLLKVSAEDLRLIYPDVAVESLVEGWLAQGVELIVVTRGGDGAAAWTATTQVKCAARATQVVDTVGAGDAFQAALLTWLASRDALRGESLRTLDSAALESMLEFASAAASFTCARHGAELPTQNDLIALNFRR